MFHLTSVPCVVLPPEVYDGVRMYCGNVLGVPDVLGPDGTPVYREFEDEGMFMLGKAVLFVRQKAA